MASRVTQPFVQVFSEFISDDSEFLKAVAEVGDLDEVLKKEASLKTFLISPGIPRVDRERVLRSSLESLGCHDVVVKTAVMLIRKNVMTDFHDFYRHLRDHADERCGIVRGSVTTAVDLSSSAQEKIQAMISKCIGKDAELSFGADEKLLGGVKVRMKGMELDASYQKQLLDAKTKLKKMRA